MRHAVATTTSAKPKAAQSRSLVLTVQGGAAMPAAAMGKGNTCCCSCCLRFLVVVMSTTCLYYDSPWLKLGLGCVRHWFRFGSCAGRGTNGGELLEMGSRTRTALNLEGQRQRDEKMLLGPGAEPRRSRTHTALNFEG
jgi:hypothetical protein